MTSRRKHIESNPEAGLAYVVMLLLLILIVTMGLGFLYQVQTEVVSASNQEAGMQADYLAETAAHHAMWRLLNESAFPDSPITQSDSSDVYFMHSLGGGRYGYKARRHTSTTLATIATVGVVDGIVRQHSYVVSLAPTSSTDKLMLIYDTDTGSSDREPWYRRWNETAWSAKDTTVNVGTRNTPWVRIEASPSGTEAVMGALSTDRDLTVAVWDGTGWGNDVEVTTNGYSTRQGFDIAYESLSGDAMVLYRVGNSSTVRYRMWNGSSWTSQQTAFNTGSRPNWLVLKSDPTSDEILVAVSRDAEENPFRLYRWDGSSWSYVGGWGGEIEDVDEAPMEIGYESQSGDALVFFLGGGESANRIDYRIWNGSSLSSTINGPSVNGSEYLKAVSNPTSDEILLGSMTGSRRLYACFWDGGAWAQTAQITTVSGTVGRERFDIAWEDNGDTAILAWGSEAHNYPRYIDWDKSTLLVTSPILSGPDTGEPVSLVRLRSLGANSEIMAVFENEELELYSSLWDGAQFADDPPTLLDTDISQNEDRPFDMAVVNDGT